MQELQSLVVSAKDGDKDAFGQIVARFQDMAATKRPSTRITRCQRRLPRGVTDDQGCIAILF